MARREVSAEIDIDAPAERVWEVLTDFARYPEWNPFLPSVAGELTSGASFIVRIAPPRGRAMTFRPTLLEVEKNRELSWLGRLLLPGLFDGEHHFVIEPQGERSVRFVQREVFTGLLVPLFGSAIGKALNGFEAMNRALKERVEKLS